MATNHPKRASAASYFYGRITREETEKILRLCDLIEGLFLLRESIHPVGNYAISVCHKGKIHHYIIEKQLNGNYMIPDGALFPGPIELLDHYKHQADGFVTCPSVPCNRSSIQQAIAFRGVTYDDLEKEMVIRARAIKNVNMEKALGQMRDHLLKMVARDLHLKQPWYHGRISRLEATDRLHRNAPKSGKFLVRQRDDKKTFALTVASNAHDIKHYIINLDNNDIYYIDDGPKFECLIMLIDHYHNKQDGLACKLTEPCPNPSASTQDLTKYKKTCNEHLFTVSSPRHSTSSYHSQNSSEFPPAQLASQPLNQKRHSRSMPLPDIPMEVSDSEFDEPDDDHNVKEFPDLDGNALESEYMEVRRRDHRFELEPSQLTLQDILGKGNFGSVRKGLCRMNNMTIQVAIKSLHNEMLDAGVEPELFKEAKLMQELNHKNIVQMIGICKAEKIMLVLELAPLGPLKNYISKNKDMTEAEIVYLMLQVAQGMAFLESKKFVHRDLAARNVLLVTRKFPKISDFGMSKALGRDNNYYKAEGKGKWPCKWLALECIQFNKFDSKSDMWSYGVTMWEALSYGSRPYGKMDSQSVFNLIYSGERLAKPKHCSDSSYEVMRDCWMENPNDRPSFSEVVSTMEILHQNLLIDGL